MNTEGLTQGDIWAFNQLLVKANNQQLQALKNTITLEQNRRTVMVIQ